MNILLINHYAGSREHGMEYRPYYLAREWTRLGHKVTIVAASSSHVRPRPPSVPDDFGYEELDGIRYLWLRTPSYSGNGAARAVNMFAFVLQLFRHGRRIVRDSSPDVIIASSTYPLDSFPAHRMARHCGAMLVYEVHDLWPLSPIELGGMSPRHPFIQVMQWAENYACRHSDRVASMLPLASQHLQEHGMKADRFHYVPNGIVPEEWGQSANGLPPEHAEALGRLRLQKRLLIGYAGAHGLANALSSLVTAANLPGAEDAGIVLIGQGPEKPRLQQLARERGAGSVTFLPPVARAAIPALLAQLDVLYLGLKRNAIFRFGISPNKLMDYMMAGKPIIQAIEAGNDLVAESGCGLSIPAEDPAAIASAIGRLAALSEGERNRMGALGRSYVLAHHDYRVLAASFLHMLK